MRFTFAPDGAIASVRGSSGMTLVPLEGFVPPERFSLGP